MTQPTTTAPAFDLLPKSARDLAAMVGDAEALRLIADLCDTARRHLEIRQSVKTARHNGHGVSVTVGRLAFVYGLPECCVWRIAEKYAPAMGERQP